MRKLLSLLLLASLSASAQNPVIRDQFTADPTARVFHGKVYLYPSHDIFPPEGPFVPEPEPIKGINGIDPCVLQASDGNAYIFWGPGRCAKLKDNMKELADGTVPQFTGADEQLWRIEQLTDGTYRIMPKRLPGETAINTRYVLYSAADSTPTLAEYDFKSDNSKWNFCQK